MNSTVLENETGVDVITAADLDGVRTARIFAFVIDYLLIALLSVPIAAIIGVLGVLTFGLAWGLYAVLLPLVAVLYLAFTLGGSNQATMGMRFMGVRMKRLGGGRIDAILAVLHGIMFWVIHSIALILPLFVTFFSSKKRLLHDIVLGVYVVRS
ncbi:MAG: RDD family protein [Pseudomonadota bacterium]